MIILFIKAILLFFIGVIWKRLADWIDIHIEHALNENPAGDRQRATRRVGMFFYFILSSITSAAIYWLVAVWSAK